MRFVKISQPEMSSMLKLYESVMSTACHGLLHREGEVVAESLAAMCVGPNDMLEYARKLLIARGWVEEISFGEREARAHGSIEVAEGTGSETCFRLRGIISKLYEKRYKSSFGFREVECLSKGDSVCVFRSEAV